jgi:hypothetical protein
LFVLIKTDGRSMEARREPDAQAFVSESAGPYLDFKIRIAREMARIDASAAFVFEGASSIEDYALRAGYSETDARLLPPLGRALMACPELEGKLREGRLSADAAALIERVLCTPGMVREGDDWIGLAETLPLYDLRRRVVAREEEFRQGKKVVEFSAYVTEDDREKLERARVIASRRAKRPLSLGETIGVVVDHYLVRFDSARKKARARRVGPTDERPQDRYVPAEVRNAIRERSGDRCEIPGCPNRIFKQLAHRVPHRNGGAREVECLLDLCTQHHALLDAGLIRMVERGEGAWQFVIRNGKSLGYWTPDGGSSRTPPNRKGRGTRSSEIRESPPAWLWVPVERTWDAPPVSRVLLC